MNDYERMITEYCSMAQDLIDERHLNNPCGKIFEQEGLLNGCVIVNDYLAHGEIGIALEHLLYMIHESDILFPLDALKTLHSMAYEAGIKTSYTTDI